MSAAAARAAVKFGLIFLILVFIILVLMVAYPAGFFKTALYVCAAGVCIRLLWPTQDEGDALIKGK